MFDVVVGILCPFLLLCCRATEKVPRLPPARGSGLHPEQQDVRDGEEPADAGRSHGLGEGRRDARHLHEGQRRRGRQVERERRAGLESGPRRAAPFCWSIASSLPPCVASNLSLDFHHYHTFVVFTNTSISPHYFWKFSLHFSKPTHVVIPVISCTDLCCNTEQFVTKTQKQTKENTWLQGSMNVPTSRWLRYYDTWMLPCHVAKERPRSRTPAGNITPSALLVFGWVLQSKSIQ